MQKVRSRSGTPVATDFSSADGSPLVQDRDTGAWYGYSNNTVNPLGHFTVQGFGAKGDGSTNDTLALQAAVDGVAAGSTLDGMGKSYIATQLNVTKALVIQNLTIVMLDSAAASQKAFNITADGVTLINCGATLSGLTIVGASGVYGDSVDDLKIFGGTFNGSRNSAAEYNAGTYHSPIQLNSCTRALVQGATALNGAQENIFLVSCLDSTVSGSYSRIAVGSCIATLLGQRILIEGNHVSRSGGSTITVNGPSQSVIGNFVRDSDLHGINLGHEPAGEEAVDNVCIGNIVEDCGQGATANTAHILVQDGENVTVANNIVKRSTTNYTGTKFCEGIQCIGIPGRLTITGNDIQLPTGNGILVDNPTNTAQVHISGNFITGAGNHGIAIEGFSGAQVFGNQVVNSNRNNASTPTGISINQGATSGTSVRVDVCQNTITDSTPYQKYGIKMGAALTAAFVARVERNNVRGWVTLPLLASASIVYLSSGNDYDGTARGGLATATNGGTTTTVTTAQCRACDTPVVAIGDAGAATLNLKPWVSTVSDGSFVVTHTAGTAAAEKIRWAIP